MKESKWEAIKDNISEHKIGYIILCFVVIFVLGIIVSVIQVKTFNPNRDIYTVEEFMSMERGLYNNEKQYHYVLKNDLDFEGVDYERKNVGNFLNTFDGGGYTLKNITLSGDYSSIFGGVSGIEIKVRGSSYDYKWIYAEIKNIKIENINILSGNNIGAVVSGIVGEKTRYPKLNNIEILSGTIGNEESVNVGGIVGNAGDITNGITNCINRATIKGFSNVGGIIGSTQWNIFNAFQTGVEKTTIENNINYGNVTAYKSNTDDNSSGNAGGIIGVAKTENNAVYIKNCKNYGNVSTLTNAYAGGIVGNVYFNPANPLTIASINYLFVDDCENNGNIFSQKYSGGIVGSLANNYTDAHFKNLKNTGSVVSGSDYAGGIVGRTLQKVATFINCTNLSDVNYIQGVNYVAGISGSYGRKFEACENTMEIRIGKADATAFVAAYGGGILAFNDDDWPKASGAGQYGASFKDCNNSGDIVALGTNLDRRIDNVGGIAGYAKNMTADNVENSGTIMGHNNIGGILGNGYYNQTSEFKDVINSGDIISLGQTQTPTEADFDENRVVGNVGGLVGKVTIDGMLEYKFINCSNNGDLLFYNNTNHAGGLIGYWVHEISSRTFAQVLQLTDYEFDYEFGYVAGLGSTYYVQIQSIIGFISDTEQFGLVSDINNLYSVTGYEIEE